jgi:hypothetical protein
MRFFFGSLLAAAVLAGGCATDASTAAPAPAGSTEREEVLSACTTFAERLCASAEPCCMASGGEYSADDCVNGVVGDFCEPASQLVVAGRATYDFDAQEACLAAHARSHDACIPDWDQILTLRRDVWSACKVVRGNVVAGDTCTTSAMCIVPDGAATSACVAGTCRELRILDEGEECPYPLGDVSVCGEGLYCTSPERDVLGTCQVVVPEGSACDPVRLNPECGLGNYCDLDTAVCRHATNFGGPSCRQGTECVSFVCDELPATCRDAVATVSGLCGAAS